MPRALMEVEATMEKDMMEKDMMVMVLPPLLGLIQLEPPKEAVVAARAAAAWGT